MLKNECYVVLMILVSVHNLKLSQPQTNLPPTILDGLSFSCTKDAQIGFFIDSEWVFYGQGARICLLLVMVVPITTPPPLPCRLANNLHRQHHQCREYKVPTLSCESCPSSAAAAQEKTRKLRRWIDGCCARPLCVSQDLSCRLVKRQFRAISNPSSLPSIHPALT